MALRGCWSFVACQALERWQNGGPKRQELTQVSQGSTRDPLQLPSFLLYLWSPGEEFEVGSITSVFSSRAMVKYSRLEDVLHGCSWKINSKLDRTYLPLPVDRIIQRTKNMINKIVQYSLIEGNCEHFVNDLRYGVPRSQQVGLPWALALASGCALSGSFFSSVMGTAMGAFIIFFVIPLGSFYWYRAWWFRKGFHLGEPMEAQ